MQTMKVIFHVSEAANCLHAFNNARNLMAIRDGQPTEIHILFNGSAISTLLADCEESPHWETLQMRGIALFGCENSMRANGIFVDQLLMGVHTVPAGMLSLVEHQQQGFLYIKP
ncbi:DsrE family protein [Edwardsiella ictaluri]|uniref:DsrE family protein n=1 Tax=Edwardsiella ictaluri TaxID=67780 RepID=UPI0039F6C965